MLRTFAYRGPVTALTLPAVAGLPARDVTLVPGRRTPPLPADSLEIARLVACGHLTDPVDHLPPAADTAVDAAVDRPDPFPAPTGRRHRKEA